MNRRGEKALRIASILTFAAAAMAGNPMRRQEAFAQRTARNGVPVVPVAPGSGPSVLAPSIVQSHRLVGQTLPLSTLGPRARTCAQWRDAFGAHFEALRHLHEVTQALARDLDAAMTKVPLANAGTALHSQAMARTLQTLSMGYKDRIDAAALEARKSVPADFFEDFDARLAWSVPLSKLASPLGNPTMIAPLRQVSEKWEDVKFAGGVFVGFFDGAMLVPVVGGGAIVDVPSDSLAGGREMRRVWVASDGGALRIEVEARPFERCLMEPTFGGQLGATGATGLVAPVTFLIDLSKTALFENTLRPDGELQPRAFGERVRIRLGM